MNKLLAPNMYCWSCKRFLTPYTGRILLWTACAQSPFAHRRRITPMERTHLLRSRGSSAVSVCISRHRRRQMKLMTTNVKRTRWPAHSSCSRSRHARRHLVLRQHGTTTAQSRLPSIASSATWSSATLIYDGTGHPRRLQPETWVALWKDWLHPHHGPTWHNYVYKSDYKQTVIPRAVAFCFTGCSADKRSRLFILYSYSFC